MTKNRDNTRSLFARYLRTAGISLLALFFALTLTGCGKQKDTAQKELVVWGFVDEDVFTPIIRDFQSTTKIKAKYIKKDLNPSYENDALNSIMSGQGPDVWAIPNDWVYRHKDKLYPLPEDIAKNDGINLNNDYADILIKDNVFDGKIYGLSPGLDALRLYYNPELYNNGLQKAQRNLVENYDQLTKITEIFNRMPTTWGELNEILPWITEKNGQNISVAGIAMGTSNNISYPEDILSLLMLQNQTTMISEDLGQASFNLPIKNSSGQEIYPGTNSLDFYTSYANPASPNYTWNSSMPNDIDAFINNKVVMIFAYSDLSQYLNQVYPGFQFSQLVVPQIGDLNDIVDYGSYTSYVVPEISPLRDSAWKFVNFLSNTSYQTYNSATSTLPPKIIDSKITPLKNRGGSTPGFEILPTLKTWNKGRYPVELDNLFRDAITRVNSGAQSSQASLDTAATKLTELLRKEGW